MSDYIANFLVVLAILFALTTSALGLSSVYTNEARADEVKIAKQMAQLEGLYNELYTFHKSPSFHENGYSASGQGDWASAVLKLDKDEKLKSYIEKLAPEKILFTWPFHSLQPLRPYHLWVTGRIYANNHGADTKETATVKSSFKKLFKLHKLSKK